ncbi:MAG: hypothetical protein KDD35_03515 [Bdellovibrionales bacterium]|nr:hypothetical protein [Bdellovibrionales bacterium]
MRRKQSRSLPFALVLLGGIVLCPFRGAGSQEIQLSSPRGIKEVCRILPPIPHGSYSEKDQKKAQDLCSIDFYDDSKVALCPKTWSTSPATMVYQISEKGLRQLEYESRSNCGGAKAGHETLAKFKQSMNQKGTSGTYSPSSLLYYHFSRFFNMTLDVPVAVYRSMDRFSHFERVTKKSHQKSMGKSAQNRAGWKWLYQAELNPTIYIPKSDLFVEGDEQIFGVLLKGSGTRYGLEINGIRSKWGEVQNLEFQETPAFLALRSGQPLEQAIQDGLAQGLKNRRMKLAMGGDVSVFQMALWMKELSEIVLLDYIFNQQDRIGNIDYKWRTYWVGEDGKAFHKKINSSLPRTAFGRVESLAKVDGVRSYLVQKTSINDNDAGGRGPGHRGGSYVNFAKKTRMLENVRHIDPETYKKLIQLNLDFESRGEIYQYLEREFRLDPKDIKSIVSNTSQAAHVLRQACADGLLHFDLDSPSALLRGGIGSISNRDSQPINCAAP